MRVSGLRIFTSIITCESMNEIHISMSIAMRSNHTPGLIQGAEQTL